MIPLTSHVSASLLAALLLFFSLAGMAHSGSVLVRDLAPLAGCWVNANGNSIEVWFPPGDKLMLGTAQTTRDGQIVFYERLRIQSTETGQLQYIAHPSNQSETRFILQSAVNGRLVFANFEHDYPTEIIYQIPTGDQLEASIAGTEDGQRKVIAFPKTRIPCGQLFDSGDK